MPFLSEAYERSDSEPSERIAAPVLWDRGGADRQQLVKRDHPRGRGARRLEPRSLPAEFAAEVDAINERIYETVNNGVRLRPHAAGLR